MSLHLHGSTTAGTAEAFAIDVAISAMPGQPVALIGPNGSGKSTVLRLIAGLLQLRSGSLTVNNQVWDDGRTSWQPERRSVGMVFQDFRLFDHLTVARNISFPLEARGETSAARGKAIQPLLEAFDLTALAERRPSTLSGGQQARVALARAMVSQPDVLLLDEAFGAVDVETRSSLHRALLDHLTPQTVTIMVTHDPIEARVLAQQLVVLDAGRTIQAGTPAEVAASPGSSFAADLLGTNLVAGAATGTEVHLATGAVLITATPASGPVHLSFQPSAITLHRVQPQGSARNVWPASIGSLTDLGGRIRVHLLGDVNASALVTPGAVTDLRLAPGTQCWASLKATEITVLGGEERR